MIIRGVCGYGRGVRVCYIPLSLSQCDANPEVSKVAVMEDKYENVLTLITYYQMVRGHVCRGGAWGGGQ